MSLGFPATGLGMTNGATSFGSAAHGARCRPAANGWPAIGGKPHKATSGLPGIGRTPRTWAAQRTINPGTVESKQNRVLVATSIDQLAKRKDSPLRFQPVAKAERQKLAQRGQEVQQSREQRRTLEAKAVDTAIRKPGAVFEPAKAQLPTSPIVAKPANQLGRNQTPPNAQRAPKPDPKFQPQPATPGRQPSVDRSNPQPEPRKAESEKQPAPGRSEAAPRETKTQLESERRAKDAAVRNQEEAQRNARGLEAKAKQESQRNASGLETKAQRVSEQPAQRKPAPSEKGATKLLNKDRHKEGNEKQSLPENPPAPRPASPVTMRSWRGIETGLRTSSSQPGPELAC